MLRVSTCDRKRSDSSGSSCRTRTISVLSIVRIVLAAAAVAVPMRIGWPARQPSPKKSPGPSMAITASRPVFDSTESLTSPSWMYITSVAGSPWEKITRRPGYFAITRLTPDESRNSWALNFREGGVRLGFLGIERQRRLSHCRQPDRERAPQADAGAVRRNQPVMPGDDIAGDAEPDAESGAFSGQHLREHVEDVGERLRREASAGIADGHRDRFSQSRHGHRDAAAGVGVLDRVAKQIRHHLLQALTVGVDPEGL